MPQTIRTSRWILVRPPGRVPAQPGHGSFELVVTHWCLLAMEVESPYIGV